MFSNIVSPWKDVQRRVSRGLSRAGEILTGVGPTPIKQFKNALIDGEEDKAIDIYTASDSDKALWHELPPSKRFPSKKHQTSSETPLHMAASRGLLRLFVTLMGKGGDPTVLNDKLETCLHSVCSSSVNAEARLTIIEILTQWKGSLDSGHQEESVSLNKVDIDGNTPIHLAAINGLVAVVERLIALGAIISIVNKSNRTCCELADESHHPDLALALELALVFQPVDSEMQDFVSQQNFPYDGVPGRMLLSGESLENDQALENFIDEAITRVSEALWAQHFATQSAESKEQQSGTDTDGVAEPAAEKLRPRAEVLLTSYAWNTVKLLQEYAANPAQVLAAAKLQQLPSVVSAPGEVAGVGADGGTTAAEDPSATKPSAESSATPPPPPLAVEKGAQETGASGEKPATATASDTPAEKQMADAAPATEAVETTDQEAVTAQPSVAAETADSTVPAGGAPSDKDPAVLNPPPPPPPHPAQFESSRAEDAVLPPISPAASAEEPPAAITVPPIPPSATATSSPLTKPASQAMAVDQEVCFICGETMLPAADVSQFLAGAVEQPGSRRLQCDSGHAFCVDCWAGSVTVQVKDNGLGCLPCPGYKCGELLDVAWAPVLLKSSELCAQMLARRKQLVVDCCDQLKACPLENCGVVVCLPVSALQPPPAPGATAPRLPQIPSSVLCNKGHLFCLECSQAAHSPCTCAQMTQWHTLVQEEVKSVSIKGKKDKDGVDVSSVESSELANALWVAANTKKCPRCQTPIEKDEGCNHMSCRKCRKEFCWICMQDWSLHSDNTGGYFQCNRFVANLKLKDIPEGSTVADLWTEENGNAHAETLRLRERNKRMARFIHHFTRFQAHGDSLKLESRMFKETERRIREGLLASLDGGSLKWLQGYQAPNPLLASLNDVPTAPTTQESTQSGEKGVPSDAYAGEKGASSVPRSGDKAESHVSNQLSAPPRLDPTQYDFKGAMGFLKEGFDELVKCRCILQWSYPYAYFEFEGEDYGDYSRPQPRRSRFERTSGHRPSFDMLQGELETLVETLSDVVARRRLRAAKDQIVLVTRAAKSKRVELESVILAHNLAQQQAAVARASGSSANNSSSAARLNSMLRQSGGSNSRRSRGEGYHRTRPMRHQPQQQTIQGLDRSDSEDSVDIAALLYEFELASAAATSANDAGDNNQAMEAILQRQRRLGMLQLRMQMLFGEDNDNETAATRDLPPPVPEPASDRPARRPRRRSRQDTNTAAASGDTAVHSTPQRATNIRQVGSSPGLGRFNYSLDPDYVDESDDSQSSDDESGPVEGVASRADGLAAIAADDEAIDMENIRRIDETTEALRGLLRFGTPEQINRAAEAMPTLSQQAATPAATRRHSGSQPPSGGGSAGHSHSRSGHRGSRQEVRLARMTQRAEEEAALNRAILLSIQENQAADRRGRNSADGTTAEGAESGAGGSAEPAEADIAMLESMGFTREQSVQALIENRLNVELAANRLLGIDF